MVVWFGTGHGAGASRDSLRYLRGAEHIARGDGYSVISHTGERESVTHWPPLYSIVIAGPIVAGLSATNSVRVVNMLSLFATLWLTGWLVRRLVPASRAAPVVAMVFVLASPAILHNHLMTWSETLFVPLVLAGLVKMLDYATRDRIVDVVAAGTWLGLAAIDRYAGAAFIAGAGLALVLWDWRKERIIRFARLFAFGVVACAPTVFWFARNYFTTRHAHDRPFQPSGLGLDQLRAAIDAVSQWLLPNGLGLRMRAAWLALVVALVVVAVRRIPKRESSARDPQLDAFGLLVGLCVAAYVGFVLVTMMFFDYRSEFRRAHAVADLRAVGDRVRGGGGARVRTTVVVDDEGVGGRVDGVARLACERFRRARVVGAPRPGAVRGHTLDAIGRVGRRQVVSGHDTRLFVADRSERVLSGSRCPAARRCARRRVPLCSCITRLLTARTHP